MNSLVKRIGKWPVKAINTVAGGNAMDKLKETDNPLLRRAINQLSPDSKIMKRMVKRYGTPAERQTFAKERVKTHAARAATIAGGSAVLMHERSKQQRKGQYYVPY